MKKFTLMLLICASVFSACKKSKDADVQEPKLIFKFKFDSTQQRLDAFGMPAIVPANHGAQSPVFNKMSSHYIELAPTAFTQLGSGNVIYRNEETTAGGDNAINFEKAILAGNNEIFFSLPIKNVTPGSYQYLRVSLAYQNYNIKFATSVSGLLYPDLNGTLASFIGFNTYIKSYKVNDSTVTVNANRKQGYWAFETRQEGFPFPTTYLPPVISGQAPAGATTVPNPISSTSSIPAGSCVVTGAFASPFVITGAETADKIIVVSLSTNKSFEWVEHSTTGHYEPAAGDTVVDMGIRGLLPIVQ
jgi:hypothetical protein